MYRGCNIERTPVTGYWTTMCLVGNMRTGYYVPLVADTLSGLKTLIRETLQKGA